jgi:hypothetical protein
MGHVHRERARPLALALPEDNELLEGRPVVGKPSPDLVESLADHRLAGEVDLVVRGVEEHVVGAVFLVPNVQHVLSSGRKLLAQGGVDKSVGLRTEHTNEHRSGSLPKTSSYGIRQAFPAFGRRFWSHTEWLVASGQCVWLKSVVNIIGRAALNVTLNEDSACAFPQCW